MEFAQFEFKLARTGKDGVSFGEKMQAIGAKVLNDAPPLPFGTEHLWEWFKDLNSGRTGSDFGANPLTFSEISAWSLLTGNKPTPWEVSMLKAMDACYLKEMAHNEQ